MVDGVVKYMIINIGNITVNLSFVSIALGLGLFLIAFIKWFLKKIKINKKFTIELSQGCEFLKGCFICVEITNIGNEKLLINRIVILSCNDKYLEIRRDKCLDSLQKECFEVRYSERNCSFEFPVKKCFIFFNDKIYMIERGENEKHKIINVQKYNSYIKNKEKFCFTKYSMFFTGENKERKEVIFFKYMIYILQFIYKTDIEDKWQFYCFATISNDGTFIAYDKLLLSKNGKPFGNGHIEKSILKYPDKIVGFIRDNWIDTSVHDISSINYTSTPEGSILAGIAEKV